MLRWMNKAIIITIGLPDRDRTATKARFRLVFRSDFSLSYFPMKGLETSKFSLYFSGSCIPITPNLSYYCIGTEPQTVAYFTILFELDMTVRPRLLARVLKEGVQFWHNYRSTVKRGWLGGGIWRKRSSGKPLKFMLLHVSIFPTSFEIFQTHLALWVCATIASLLNYGIFIQPGTPSKCQMYNNNENWSFSFRIC
jgi:hypothetical protein